ncbi:MAG TPA: hypothetical protein DCW94_07495, partial [Porticoccaceae bacterium]|nr:hypothetical protein [Porticoccaceae bacterium]
QRNSIGPSLRWDDVSPLGEAAPPAILASASRHTSGGWYLETPAFRWGDGRYKLVAVDGYGRYKLVAVGGDSV